jgi:deoxyribonuclease-1-like protein
MFILILCIIACPVAAQVKFCSWNIQNFGKSKSDSEVVIIAQTLRDFDLVSVVEVVAGNGGAQAVARLADVLNRAGAKWSYVISNPTTGSQGGSERYAFLWKTASLRQHGKAWLDTFFCAEIEREPFMSDFVYGERHFTAVAFHAVPKSRQPEREIKYLRYFPEKYTGKVLVFAGDFNCPQSHTVFNPLREMGFQPAFAGCKTTLKTEMKNGECLASEYDNIFYPASQIARIGSGTVAFYSGFASLRAARQVSDHLPVWLEFDFSR